MREKREIKENQLRRVKDSEAAPPSSLQIRDAIQNAITQWKSQGIQDW